MRTIRTETSCKKEGYETFCWRAAVKRSRLAVTAARAAETAANTIISSTASATYNNPNNAGAILNTASNTAAEVAGITIGAVTDLGHSRNVLPGGTFINIPASGLAATPLVAANTLVLQM